MTPDSRARYLQLNGFIDYPVESLDIEYKTWIDVSAEKSKAMIAKAAIALSNSGGGFLIIGFQGAAELQSVPRPHDLPDITQDKVNDIIRKYAEPAFHCQVRQIAHKATKVIHPIIEIPPSDVPIMCKRNQEDAGVSQHRFYVRKPGPRSEEPQTAQDWRTLLDRCIRARREVMLDSIRLIVLGATSQEGRSPDALADFCAAAHERWAELVSDLPGDSPARFPAGYYEMGFALVGADPVTDFGVLQKHLAAARRTKLSGWTPFLELSVEGWEPYFCGDVIEAWVGKPVNSPMQSDSSHADFWRASIGGELYTIRGYAYDGNEAQDRGHGPGEVFDIRMPIHKVAEGLLFANRFAQAFGSADEIDIRCTFTGLTGRSLVLYNGYGWEVYRQYTSHTPEVTEAKRVTPQQIETNLPEIVLGILKPLYQQFGYVLNLREVRGILSQMRPYR